MWHWEAYQFIRVGHRAKSIILSSLFGGRMLSVLYALILISAYICFKLIYVYDRSFGFFLSSWYPMWFETFYFILFLIRMVAFSVYIFSSLSARMEEFFFYDYSYFARPNFGMMCMPASSIVAEVVYFQRVMVSI